MLFAAFGSGPRVAPRHLCLHHAFEEQAKVRPDAVAVEHAGRSITYGQLNRQATTIAAHLVENGVAPGDAVGLFLRRSIPMVVGILAVLKVGGAYVPQDAKIVPAKQLRQVLKQSRAQVVLTTTQHAPAIPSDDALPVDIERLLDETADKSLSLQSTAPALPDDRCFILFTSGTTGKPNGVQVTHRNVANILLTSPGDLGVRPGLRVAQLLNIGFDMAAWEIFGCLCNGGTLLIRGDDMTDTASRADVIIATPSILGAIDANHCRNVKSVAVAGEPCPRPLADKWAAFSTFYNCCGPTETTIVNTMQRHDPQAERLTIGRPIPNNTVYILDENLKPAPIGEVGLMWAGGDCVTAGYVGNDALTRERYQPDPFLGKGRMMFNTRDLGRWTPNGELEHLGRIDDQVKVRGFRVELDSVSTILETVDGCEKAVTLKYDDRHLVAFVSPGEVDIDQAFQAIETALPYYCKPLMIIGMDDWPRTSRGKVDRRRLMGLAIAQRPGRSNGSAEGVQ
ncbi:MAG: amino acid adenylation domain-containing protein [Geminicoccaceae bacterium]